MRKILLIVGGVILFIIIIAIAGGGGEKKGTESEQQLPEGQAQTEQKFSFGTYITESKVREYKIANEEDISIKALGGKKLSDYSSEELAELPNNFRMKYQIIVPSDITLEELKSTLAQVIKEKSAANPEIDEIAVQAWESEESLNGGNPTIGYAEWCPNGKWENVSPEIAKNNVRDSYKIVYSIDEEALEAIKKGGEETLYGLSEATRKAIFEESVLCEYEEDRKAMRYYFPGCESCPEFITADVNKYADKSTEMIDSCKEIVRNKYNITEDVALKISVEALEERWPMPEFVPMPSCCQ